MPALFTEKGGTRDSAHIRRITWTALLLLSAACLLFAARPARAVDEVMPPAPKAYFNDYAGVVRPEAARKLNGELETFEKETSNQLVVAVFPKMQSPSSIEDYTVRVAQSWHAGQKGRDNGAVLFVFIQDRKMLIQVGYGLEGALTDYRCKQIVENDIKPRFKAGDYAGGLAAGVHAMIAATKGEYKGTGLTANQHRQKQNSGGGSWIPFLLFFVIWIIFALLNRGRRGSTGYTGGGPIFYGGGWGGGGGGSGGGGGGGGFSGGGGSFGGGGAGGSW